MINEMKRLHDLGFAVHFLKAKSKAPVKAKWSGPTRDTMQQLQAEYRGGYGVGVRLGEPSALASGYLCVIDIDIKSDHPRHKEEAFAVVDAAFPGLIKTAPTVKTGRGYHIYARTNEPMNSGKIKTSNEQVKVYSPTSEMNRRQAELLTPDEIRQGLRVKNAWEVEFMSIGKQVVLPPTKHPDTGKSYEWKQAIQNISDLSFISWAAANGDGVKKSDTPSSKVAFTAVAFDIVTSKLSDRIVNMILTGEGVSDRSAACFSVAIAMLKTGCNDQEVMSVLTDRSTFLGETAFDHRKTNNRANAAAWVYEHSILKARELIRADKAFEDEVGISPLLDEAGTIQQVAELTTPGDWRQTLARSGKDGDGPPRPTLENVVIVLRNAVGEQLFKRDLFALRDCYGLEAPWGAQAGKAITDDDTVQIKMWIAENYRFEPSTNIISEAITVIAMWNGHHPIRDQWAQLPEWDCVPRLDTWLAKNFQAEGDSEYLAQVFRKWVVAAVTRIYMPGTKFDWMIIFEGTQGIGKSSFGRILFGDKYFSDWLPNLNDKDAAIGLQGMQCIEFGELAGLRKQDLEIVKAFVARTVDKFRPPHGKKNIESPRQCVFFGTTNRDEYLKDDTGNRRFNPVKVGALNFAALARDRDQLIAEAIFLYRNELETWFELEGSAAEYAIALRLTKMVQDEASLMLEDIRKNEEDPDGIKFKMPEMSLILNDLFSEQGPLSRWKRDNRHMQFAAKALKALGYEKSRANGGRCWHRKPCLGA